jgi:hypothetical protein
MRTLTLDPESLRVDSFSTGSAQCVLECAIPTTRTQEPGCTSPTMCNPTIC